MAFGKDKKLEKQDLIDAGLDPDKFSDLIGTAVKKADLDALKTDLTAQLSQTVTDQIKAGFTELENKLKPAPVNNGGGNDEQPTDEEKFLTNPTGYVKEQVGALGRRAAVEIMGTRRQIAYDSLSKTLKCFQNEALRQELEEEWKKYTPEVLARNNADPADMLTKINNMIIGNHIDEINRDTAKKEGKFNMIHSSTSSGGNGQAGGGSNDNKGGQRTLTPKEQKVAKSFGMTDEEWIKQEKEMEEEEDKRHEKVSA